MTAPRPFHDLFVLDMQRVLATELESALSRLEPVGLTHENLQRLRATESDRVYKGIYILHYLGEVVYVGKADNSLRERLEEHLGKLKARQQIDISKVGFRCLYLDANWSALAHEETLINHFKTAGYAKWNATGFGIHDPGRNRDSTELDENHFDRLHPIDDSILVGLNPGRHSVLEALQKVKGSLPYLVRFESTREARELMASNHITTTQGLSVRGLMELVANSLGDKWQVSILFGYVILYREHKDYSIKSCQRYKRGGDPWTILHQTA
jgi:hypothetical protein